MLAKLKSHLTACSGMRESDCAKLLGRADVRRGQDGGGTMQRGRVPHVDGMGGVVQVYQVGKLESIT